MTCHVCLTTSHLGGCCFTSIEVGWKKAKSGETEWYHYSMKLLTFQLSAVVGFRIQDFSP